MENKKNVKQVFKPPKEAIESVARCILPSIQRFYESEENSREFEVLLEHRNRNSSSDSEKRL